MKHVVHVITRLNIGGPAVQLHAQGELLDGAVRQTVLTGQPQEGETDIRKVVDFSLPVIDLPQLTRRPGFRDVLAIRHVRKELARLQPDIVHTHTSKAGLVGRFATRTLGADPLRVHTFHATLTQQYEGRAQRFILGIERSLARYTDRFVFLSQGLSELHLELGIGDREDHRVVPGLLPSARHVKIGRAEARAQLGLPPDRLLIGYLGRLDPIKRFDRFIEAVQLTRSAGHDAGALIVGSGPDRAWVKTDLATMRQRGIPVHHEEWMADPRAALAAADVIVIPSDSEGFPLVLLEAALQGTPVVATDVGAIGEFITDGVSGRLVRRTAGELAEAAGDLLSDSDARCAMAVEAERRVRAMLDPDHVRRLLIELYGIDHR